MAGVATHPQLELLGAPNERQSCALIYDKFMTNLWSELPVISPAPSVNPGAFVNTGAARRLDGRRDEIRPDVRRMPRKVSQAFL
jgi:hypothetical protein